MRTDARLIAGDRSETRRPSYSTPRLAEEISYQRTPPSESRHGPSRLLGIESFGPPLEAGGVTSQHPPLGGGGRGGKPAAW